MLQVQASTDLELWSLEHARPRLGMGHQQFRVSDLHTVLQGRSGRIHDKAKRLWGCNNCAGGFGVSILLGAHSCLIFPAPVLPAPVRQRAQWATRAALTCFARLLFSRAVAPPGATRERCTSQAAAPPRGRVPPAQPDPSAKGAELAIEDSGRLYTPPRPPSAPAKLCPALAITPFFGQVPNRRSRSVQSNSPKLDKQFSGGPGAACYRGA